MAKKIGELMFQIIPVMIGVYLGFLVSNYSTNNQKKLQSQIFVENLLSEIEMNKNRLQGVLKYHEMLRDSSRFYSSPDVKTIKPDFFEGTRVIKLTTSAYDTGIQTGAINELSIGKIQAINRLYTFQNDYNEFGNIMMASLINKEFSDNEEDMKKIVRFLSLTMTDIVIKEMDLLEGYEMVQEIVEG